MTEKKRFNKARLVEDLRHMAEHRRTGHKFDTRTGTAQLKPAGSVDRAVAYGEWKMLEWLADEIEGGFIGAGKAGSEQ